ncbi:MAG: hypothetical protein D6781_10475 [Verrucomicrobia bacterium]|nr:MAG: hypothetical protein D6781_10475 [Verrucomicrobiota bacterium]
MDRHTRRDAFARLRRQLDARSRAATSPVETPVLATGIPGIDAPLGGGLPLGALSEIVCGVPSGGGQLLLLHLLHAARRAHRFLALVDAADSFDPQSVEPSGLLRHLLWVRCRDARQALQAADLLARDPNFGLLALDLRDRPESELRRIRSTAWYRLQRIVEPAGGVLAVLTPRRLLPAAARARIRLERPLPLTALAMEQRDLAEQLTPHIDRAPGSLSWSTPLPAGAPPADTPDYIQLNSGTGGPSTPAVFAAG